jgi:hypothetical protein
MTRDQADLFNGLLFGKKDVRFILQKGTTVNQLSLDVNDKNNYGNLLVIFGDETIYDKDPPIGHIEIPINRPVSADTSLLIAPSSSSWKMWAPATFSVSNVVLSLKSDVVKSDSFDFDVFQDEYDNLESIELQMIQANSFDIFVNGNKIANYQISKSDLLVGANTIEFVPRSGRNFSGKAVLNIFYKE